jgi:hypothetical protein
LVEKQLEGLLNREWTGIEQGALLVSLGMRVGMLLGLRQV